MLTAVIATTPVAPLLADASLRSEQLSQVVFGRVANVLERALILGRGQVSVSPEHLPAEFRARGGPGERKHVPLSLDDLERQHIERTLKHHDGNRTRAADELGISRATLINKLRRFSSNS